MFLANGKSLAPHSLNIPCIRNYGNTNFLPVPTHHRNENWDIYAYYIIMEYAIKLEILASVLSLYDRQKRQIMVRVNSVDM